MKPGSANTRFTTLFRDHYDEVLAYCTRRVGRTEADEATADVFVVAWRRVDEIEWETARAWLYGIARGVLANRWRSAKRRTRLLGRLSGLAPAYKDDPDVQVVRRAEDEDILTALRRLKVLDQEVLMLASWEELTAPEIALALGVSVSAAEQRLHRAKKRLAQILVQDIPRQRTSPRVAEETAGGS